MKLIKRSVLTLGLILGISLNAAAQVSIPNLDKPAELDFSGQAHAWLEHFSASKIQDSDSIEKPVQKSLELQDAVYLSLKNNSQFLAKKLDPSLAAQAVLLAKSQLDTTFDFGASKTRAVEPSSSRLIDSSFTSEDQGFDLGASTRFYYGTDLNLRWTNNKVTDTSAFVSLDPQYRSQLRLSMSQPILSGFGWGAPIVEIRLNQKISQAALYKYKADVANQILHVIQSYWAQSLAAKVVEVKESSLKLAEQLQKETSASVKVGILAPVAVSETQAQVALRKEELITAQNNLNISRNQLRTALGVDFEQDDLEYYDLADQAKFEVTNFIIKDSVISCLENCPEIKAEELSLEAAKLSAKFANNKLLPSLNLEGSSALKGLAGRPRNDEDAAALSDFNGGFNHSLDELGTTDYYDYTVGLRLKIPFENRAARSRANTEQINLRKQELNYRSVKQNVIENLLKALYDLEASRKRHQAGQEALKYAQESLDAATKKLQAGLVTVRQVLDAQEDYSQAQFTLVKALTDFQVALAETYRSRGELLEKYKISISN